MGQVANCKYVCDAINAKWGSYFVPVAGTELQVANCEYLLKMVDKANRGRTSCGTGVYSTLQVVDKVAVDKAVETLWLPGRVFLAFSHMKQHGPFIYSKDGITWTELKVPYLYVRDAIYASGRFVAVGYSAIHSSVGGILWEVVLSSPDVIWEGVTYGGGKFVAIGHTYVSGVYRGMAAISTDGVNWSDWQIADGYWRDVAYGDGKFVAVEGSYVRSNVVEMGTGRVAYSTDGTFWKDAELPSDKYIAYHGVSYNAGMFVVLGRHVYGLYSTDGVTWSSMRLPVAGPVWHSIVYGGGRWLAVGDHTCAVTSVDGVEWSFVESSSFLHGVAYGDGKFVVVADYSRYNGPIYHYVDGVGLDLVAMFGGGVFFDCVVYGGEDISW